MKKFPLLLAALTLTALPLASAQRSAPGSAPSSSDAAALNGTWRVEAFSSPAQGEGLRPGGQLTISNRRISGTTGCTRFGGTLNAQHNVARVRVRTLPPPLGAVRCLYVVRGSLVEGLNAAAQYTVSPRHLVLFSGTARVVLERVGRAPARK